MFEENYGYTPFYGSLRLGRSESLSFSESCKPTLQVWKTLLLWTIPVKFIIRISSGKHPMSLGNIWNSLHRVEKIFWSSQNVLLIKVVRENETSSKLFLVFQTEQKEARYDQKRTILCSCGCQWVKIFRF